MFICIERVTDEVIYDYVGILPYHQNALYYSTRIGRRRIYRQSYPVPAVKNLRLFTYKKKENAQKLCDYVNYQTGSKYKIKEVN